MIRFLVKEEAMGVGIITLVSVVINAVAAIVAPLLVKRMAAQQGRIQQAEEALGTISAGLQVVEQAVEENKDGLSRCGAGDKIAKTIRTYGPAAKELVDAARVAAQSLRAGADEGEAEERL